LNRYITNIWLEDYKQQREVSLSIPVLIYHGKLPIQQESPRTLFPSAPEYLLEYVPKFKYVLLDTARIPDDKIERLGKSVLRNVFLALKYSRDENFLRDYWRKILIFAVELQENPKYAFIIKSTLFYMYSVSKTIQQKINEPEQHFMPQEAGVVLPPFMQKSFMEGKDQSRQGKQYL
jgi:hypothetical protein